MCNPTPTDWAYRTVAGRVPSIGIAVGVLAVTLAWSVGALHAQTTQVAESDSGAQTSQLAASLTGVPGVEPGMTLEQLLEVGRTALGEGRLGDGRKILLTLIAHDRTNLTAMSHLAFAL